MLSMNDLKTGSVFKYGAEPYIIIQFSHVHMGRGGSTLRVKMRNLVNGKVLERTFKPGDKIEEAQIETKRSNFLYSDKFQAYFMIEDDYDQVGLEVDEAGDRLKYLKEGAQADIVFFEDSPVGVEVPKKVKLRVVSSPEAVRGNTASGNVTKIVRLETGLEIPVPLFIREGDSLVINTDTGEYVERAS